MKYISYLYFLDLPFVMLLDDNVAAKQRHLFLATQCLLLHIFRRSRFFFVLNVKEGEFYEIEDVEENHKDIAVEVPTSTTAFKSEQNHCNNSDVLKNLDASNPPTSKA